MAAGAIRRPFCVSVEFFVRVSSRPIPACGVPWGIATGYKSACLLPVTASYFLKAVTAEASLSQMSNTV
jgi:hypothetical protein